MFPARCLASICVISFCALPCDSQSSGPGPAGENSGAPSNDNGSGGSQGGNDGVSAYQSDDPSNAGQQALVDSADGQSGFAALGPCTIGFAGQALRFTSFQVLVTAGRCRSRLHATNKEEVVLDEDILAASYSPAGGAGSVCRTVFAVSAGPERLQGGSAVSASSPDGLSYAGKVVRGKCHFGVAPGGADSGEVFTRDYDVLSPDGFPECEAQLVEPQRAEAAHLVWWPEESSSSAAPPFTEQYVLCVAEHDGVLHPGYARGDQLTLACEMWCATSTSSPQCDAAVCRACSQCGGGDGGTPGRTTAGAATGRQGLDARISSVVSIAFAMGCFKHNALF